MIETFMLAAYKLGVRDTFIGWSEEERKRYLPHVLNNNRFLILPWVQVKNLASHLIALSIKQLKRDWPLQPNLFLDYYLRRNYCAYKSHSLKK